MAIKAEELQDIETMLTDADASIFATLRQKYPHLAWSRCDASDVLEEPYRSFKAFDMHLSTSAIIVRSSSRTRSTPRGMILAAMRS